MMNKLICGHRERRFVEFTTTILHVFYHYKDADDVLIFPAFLTLSSVMKLQKHYEK